MEKILKLTETTLSLVLLRAFVDAHREKTRAAKQYIIEAQAAMSMEVLQSHVLKGGAKSGKTVIPEIPSPALNHRKNLIFTGKNQPEYGTAKFHGSK